MEEIIISNLNQKIKVNISIDEEDNLTFKAYNEDNQKLYSKNFEFEEIKQNNYFYLSENISDIFTFIFIAIISENISIKGALIAILIII